MRKVFLFGHTGSQNRGCEAIVRATTSLIRKLVDDEIVLITYNDIYDKKFGLDNICTVRRIGNPKKKFFQRGRCAFERIFLKRHLYAESLVQHKMLSSICPDDFVFIIGGDTYCYNEPPISCYAANLLAKKKGAKTVLWACSLEKNKIDKKMLADFENYDFIVPREVETYQLLMSLGLKNPRIIVASDPAFHLATMPLYEEVFISKKFIGLNVSPIAYKNEAARANVINWIRHILADTDKSILLIPHVYTEGRIDADVLTRLYTEISCKERVFLVQEELSCEQLKFLISNCEAFVGCRTHSTIAAYSTGVPTLVIGYSVKSKGIAEDLFSTSDGYVVMYDAFENDQALHEAFSKIWENREQIAERLNTLMPEYKDRSIVALKKILCQTEAF